MNHLEFFHGVVYLVTFCVSSYYRDLFGRLRYSIWIFGRFFQALWTFANGCSGGWWKLPTRDQSEAPAGVAGGPFGSSYFRERRLNRPSGCLSSR